MKLGTKQIGTVTVVYVAEDEYGDKGGWITQSYPTNFHSFWQEKTLVKGDSVDNYKWVSDAEKTTIEGKDAKWEEPSEEFVREWNSFCCVTYDWYKAGKYNNDTGYFELNGIYDLTYKEAIDIVTDGTRYKVGVYRNSTFRGRTNLPFDIWYNGGLQDARAFYSALNLEVALLQFIETSGGGRNVKITSITIQQCPKLKQVLGNVYPDGSTAVYFQGCPNLEYVNFSSLYESARRNNINLSQSPLLNLQTFKDLTRGEYTTVTPSVQVSLHRDVYCKFISSLTEEEATDLFTKDGVLNETALARWKEIKATMTEEEQAEWKAVWKTGKEKNISFAY